MINLDSLKQKPADLFEFLTDELNKLDTLPLEITSFFEINDIFELAESAIDNNCSILTVQNVINKIGINKEFELDIFLNFLKALHKNNESYFPWFTTDLFSKIAKQYPDKAILLIDSIKELDYQLVPEAIATIVINNDNLSPNQKYDYALLFIKSGMEKQYLAGYAIIEKCVLNGSFSRKNEAITLLKESLSTKENSELASAVKSACNLSISEKELQNDIFLIRKNNNPSTNKVISTFLFLNSKAIIESEFLKKLFLTFTNIPCELKGIISDLDFILMDLVKTDFDLFFNFITKWIDESDFKNNSISFCEIWSSFFSSLDFNKHVVFIYTTFFLKDEIEYHIVAADIIHNKGIMSEYIFNLDEEIIKECDADDIIFLCRKILGHIYDIKKMCDLFNSLLIIKIEGVQITNAIQNLFITLANDYGFVVINYIKSKSTDEDTRINTIYKNILTVSEKNNELYLKKQDYYELNATYEELLELSRKEFERQNKISEQAEEQSIMSKLCTKIPLKYGIGFSSCYNGKNTNVSLLKEFSATINMSKQDIYSPVHEQLLRLHYKLYKRGES